jgi:hypothetical protein
MYNSIIRFYISKNCQQPFPSFKWSCLFFHRCGFLISLINWHNFSNKNIGQNGSNLCFRWVHSKIPSGNLQMHRPLGQTRWKALK